VTVKCTTPIQLLIETKITVHIYVHRQHINRVTLIDITHRQENIQKFTVDTDTKTHVQRETQTVTEKDRQRNNAITSD